MKNIVILTGSGISADSGLQTFRDNDGLWENYKVEDVATLSAFRRNPKLVIDFYNKRRRQLKEVFPNNAHISLVKLEKYFNVKIITQNVDNLHERAGSKFVLHLHGQLCKLRSTVDENYIIDLTEDQNINDVDRRGNPLRPHIVWFGEDVPLFNDSIDLVKEADILLIIGTSLQVYPASSLISYVKDAVDIYLVDLNPIPISGVTIIKGRAFQEVPKLVNKLISKYILD